MKDGWTRKEIDGDTCWVCGEWHVMCVYRRRAGRIGKDVYWIVSNDNTIYDREYRSLFAAMNFAEKHFKKEVTE